MQYDKPLGVFEKRFNWATIFGQSTGGAGDGSSGGGYGNYQKAFDAASKALTKTVRKRRRPRKTTSGKTVPRKTKQGKVAKRRSAKKHINKRSKKSKRHSRTKAF